MVIATGTGVVKANDPGKTYVFFCFQYTTTHSFFQTVKIFLQSRENSLHNNDKHSQVVKNFFCATLRFLSGMLKELGELTENQVRNVLELHNWSKRKVTAGKVEPIKKFLEEEKVKMVKGELRQLLLLLLQVFSFLYSSYIEVNQKNVYPSLYFHLASLLRSQLNIVRTQKSANIFLISSSFFICKSKRRNLASRKSIVL